MQPLADTAGDSPAPPDRPAPVPQRPDERPVPGPTGPRTPYPVNDPGIADPTRPGADPDYVPPTRPMPGM